MNHYILYLPSSIEVHNNLLKLYLQQPWREVAHGSHSGQLWASGASGVLQPHPGALSGSRRESSVPDTEYTTIPSHSRNFFSTPEPASSRNDPEFT